MTDTSKHIPHKTNLQWQIQANTDHTKQICSARNTQTFLFSFKHVTKHHINKLNIICPHSACHLTWQRVDSAVNDNGTRLDPVSRHHLRLADTHHQNICLTHLHPAAKGLTVRRVCGDSNVLSQYMACSSPGSKPVQPASGKAGVNSKERQKWKLRVNKIRPPITLNWLVHYRLYMPGFPLSHTAIFLCHKPLFLLC